MKVLEDTKALINSEFTQCKSPDDVTKLFARAQTILGESRAPYGQKQHMWEEIKEHLSGLSRRPDVVNHAHALIEGILKKRL